nr:acyltransferase [Parvularcula mediterranea]
MRGVAAMSVVALHYQGYFERSEIGELTFRIFSGGNLAVDLFFVLSGFIMAYVYGRSIDAGTFEARGFYIKRFARLYPVHLITLLAALALSVASALAGIGGEKLGQNLGTLPATFLAVHAWGFTATELSPNYPSWSISAELFAYLLFPIVFYPLLTRLDRHLTLALAVLFFAGLYFSFGIWSEWIPVQNYKFSRLANDFGIIRIIPAFAMGMALFRIYQHRKEGDGFGYLAATGLLAFGAIACVVFEISDGIIIIMLALMIYTMSCAEPAVQAISGFAGGRIHRALVYLGTVSYSIYMVHAVLQTVLFKGWETLFGPDLPIWTFWLSVCAAFPAGAALYHLVEKPGRKVVLKLLMPRFAKPKASTPQAAE